MNKILRHFIWNLLGREINEEKSSFNILIKKILLTNINNELVNVSDAGRRQSASVKVVSHNLDRNLDPPTELSWCHMSHVTLSAEMICLNCVLSTAFHFFDRCWDEVASFGFPIIWWKPHFANESRDDVITWSSAMRSPFSIRALEGWMVDAAVKLSKQSTNLIVSVLNKTFHCLALIQWVYSWLLKMSSSADITTQNRDAVASFYKLNEESFRFIHADHRFIDYSQIVPYTGCRRWTSHNRVRHS